MQELSHSDFIRLVEAEVEEQLKEVILVFQNLREDLLLQPAANDGWSIAECFAHLNTYADFYLPRISKALDQASPIDELGLFKHSFLGRYFINMMDTSRGRRKYKALKRHQPIVLDPYVTVSMFIQYLENMLDLLKKARKKNLVKKSVATSLSPWLKINPGDAMWFVLTHSRRHLEQAKRNL
jgi:DinB superfamily